MSGVTYQDYTLNFWVVSIMMWDLISQKCDD